ncbi:MAG: CDP-diacylglycerol--glycerol-3-phosphate 3-phosphatidyltransferase [Planctomycetes bacterium]|nr:CDP-diacylglycerol--glycerol-3-phosphate 3-phosphatidyltransferase [Planctomycetota bacterium]
MTLANKITTARFFLTVVYFILLGVHGRGVNPLMLDVAFALFLAAVIGDALDGYVARKYRQVTPFGRIADPFVDKILVCGSFIFFITLDPLERVIPAWMVVLIVAREFLVTGIRGVAEAQGIPFGASAWGKLKMVVQSSVAGTALVYAAHLSAWDWTGSAMHGLMWIATAVTALSGVLYVADARKLFRSRGI